MSKRYSIVVVPYGWPRETELCQCDTNPEAIMAAAREKTVRIHSGDGYRHVAKYERIRIVDREADAS